MTVRRRLSGLEGPSPRRSAKSRIGGLWHGPVPVSPDIARLGDLAIILREKLRSKKFNGVFFPQLGKTFPLMIYFAVGDRRMLCINTQSEKFKLGEGLMGLADSAEAMLRMSVTVLKEKGYAREFAQPRKRDSYNYVFDPHHRLYAVAEPEVDHDTIEKSFEALKRLKIIDESVPAQYERGEFKAGQDLIV